MRERLKVISLSANTELANEICSIIGVQPMPSTLMHFADGEVCFEGGESFRGDNIYIVQSTCNPVNDRLMEVLLCIDACKRAGANSITCVIPYFGYSRQDRKAKPRQPISCKLVANLLQVAGADRVVCCDLHANQIAGFFDIPVDDISSMPLFYEYVINNQIKDIVCVSPDHGGVVRTSKFAEKLGAPIAIIDKRRPKANSCEIVSIVGDIEGKNCLIFDDIIDTGGTLCKAALKLKELGAKSIYAFATHGVFSNGAVDRFTNSAIDKLVISNSIPCTQDHTDKLEVVSLAPILAKVIVAIEEGKSISTALDEYERGNI